MQRICIGRNSIVAPWGCFRDSPTSAFIQSCQNDDTVSSESQWHLIVMRGYIRGSRREPVEVQDLSIDLVLSQNLNTDCFLLCMRGYTISNTQNVFFFKSNCQTTCTFTGSVSSKQESRSTKLNTVLAIRLVTPGPSWPESMRFLKASLSLPGWM